MLFKVVLRCGLRVEVVEVVVEVVPEVVVEVVLEVVVEVVVEVVAEVVVAEVVAGVVGKEVVDVVFFDVIVTVEDVSSGTDDVVGGDTCDQLWSLKIICTFIHKKRLFCPETEMG